MTVTGKVQKFLMREQSIEELGLQAAAGVRDGVIATVRLTANQGNNKKHKTTWPLLWTFRLGQHKSSRVYAISSTELPQQLIASSDQFGDYDCLWMN